MEGKAKKTFQEVISESELPVLVDFWAPWCAPCRQIAPLIDEVAQEYGDRIQITKVNVEEYPEIASRYQVMGLPTLMMFKSGQPVDALAGGVSKAALTGLITKTA